jgi:hypothetical protein
MKTSSVFDELSYAVNTHRFLGGLRIREVCSQLSALDGLLLEPAVK